MNWNNLRYSLGGRLRERLHRCYGPTWENQIQAMSEPPWLRSVWHWCGLPFVLPRKFVFPYDEHDYDTRTVQDPDGTWWIERTYNKSKWPDIRELFLEQPLSEINSEDSTPDPPYANHPNHP